MTSLRALDLFCGGGGAARGLIAAGFDVVGIDIKDHRKSYPGLFIQGDALRPPVRLADFDFVWASPPCQAFSPSTPKRTRGSHPNLVPATRELLASHPYTVMENVPRAPIRPDVVLTGAAVGLPRIIRHRIFETSFLVTGERGRNEFRNTVPLAERVCPVGRGTPSWLWRKRRHAGLKPNLSTAELRVGMGISDDRMTRKEIAEAIPPAYAEFIGRAAIEAIHASS